MIVIKSFGDRDTERVFEGRKPKRLPQKIVNRAETKLAALDAAKGIEETRVPPGNRLHKLGGDREGGRCGWTGSFECASASTAATLSMSR
ncbi:MAG: type II toxin-antitoxin system RelE/ParE family toxin [Rubrobacteraceae bacterium]|jgi:proteic killer suppression protein